MNKNDLLKMINNISKKTGHIPKHIEKDYYLDFLLEEISNDEILSELLIFKGGTCLSKGYFNYYRMSEDLDFSVNFHSKKIPLYKTYEEFVLLGRSGKQKIRSKISNILIDRLIKIIYSDNLSFLDIYEVTHEKCIKSQNEYISCIKRKLKHNESKLLRLKIGYTSVITGKEDKVLIEIGIGSYYWFNPSYRKLKSIFELVEPINILSHNIYQIFAEKFSAMTDRTYHERRIAIRDYFDIQFLYPLVKDNIDKIIPIIGEIYKNDFKDKKGIEGFLDVKGMIDFNFDYDFIIEEIFNQEQELLQPAPNEVQNFLNQENLDYLYNNIYFPIQNKIKEYLGIPTNIHLTDGLIELDKNNK